MSAASAAVVRLRVWPGAIAGRLQRVRPVPVLGLLVALQLAQVAWYAIETPHNGWIWYSGGDSTSYWTEEWSVGHLLMPPAAIGFGLPIYYAWVPLVAGPSLISGLAVIAVLQSVVLVPLALVLFWLVADRLFGRVYAWFAAFLWVAAPLLLLHGFVPSYHPVFDDLFLAPFWFGLTNMADLPSLVAVLACAWLTLRAYDLGRVDDYVLGGLLAGVALGLKPANAFFLPAVAVLLIAARRPRLAAVWLAALVPALVTLALWKWRGLGYLPVTTGAYQQVRVAAGASLAVGFTFQRYIPLDFRHLYDELQNLREVFWSLRFLEILMIAGVFGVIRKAPAKGVFVVVWCIAFCVIKASSSNSDFPSATFFRLSEPGLPACLLIAVGAAYCVPHLARRGAAISPAPAPPLQRSSLNLRILVPAIVVCAVVPLALVGLVRSPSVNRTIRDENRVQEAPLTTTMHLSAQRTPGGTLTLTWQTPDVGSTQPSFMVFASNDDNGCVPVSRGAKHCWFNTMPTIGTTRANTFVDKVPRTQRRWYRVALVANFRRDGLGGDYMLMSHAVFVPGGSLVTAVLFTCAGQRVDIVTAFGRAGATTIAADADRLAPALYHADVRALVPRVDDAGYVPALSDLIAEHSIRLVVPLTDLDHVVLARSRQRLAPAVVLVPDEETSELCADKYLADRFFREHDIGSPPTWLPDDVPDTLPFPVLVKARRGFGSRHIYQAHNPSELEFFLRYTAVESMVQAVCKGVEFSIDVFCDLDARCVAAVPRTMIESKGGESIKGMTIKDPDLIAFGRLVAETLRLVGPGNVQCFREPDGRLQVTDVNPRFGGGFPLPTAAASRYPELALALANGEHIEARFGEFRDGIVMTRFFSQVILEDVDGTLEPLADA